jgi:protein tyrosine kinase modulator
MGILQLLAILWARRVVIMGCFFTTVALAVGITLMLPKSYQASVSVLVDHEARNAYTDAVESRIALNEFLGKQVAIVKSERTAHQVVSDLRLTQNPRFRREFFASHHQGTMEDWIADQLISSLGVGSKGGESSLVISYRSPDPDTAATVANAFADAYMRTDIDIKIDTAQQTAARLREQARQLQKELSEAEQNLHDYQRRTGLVVSNGGLDSEMKKLDSLQTLQTDTNTQTENARAQLGAFRQAKASGLSLDQLEGVANNTLINSLRTQIAGLNADLAQLRNRYGSGYPDYVSGLAKKAALEKEISGELNRVEGALEAQVSAGEQRSRDLQKAIDDQKTRVVNLQKHWDEYSVYFNQVQTKRAELDQTVKRSGAEAIESRVSAMSALILSPADPPPKPNYPNLSLNTLLGVAFGGFFGLVMAVLVELFDRRIRSADDFEDAAGAPVIVVMPKRA